MVLMTRMKKMTNKKRKKVSRHRGSHTHGRGAKKKARGKGHRGGIGNAGTGKRGDQKKTLILKIYGNTYFGKDKVRRAGKKLEIRVINLQNITDNLSSFIKKGVVKNKDGSYDLDLKTYKIIGNSEIKIKLKIDSLDASKGAVEAVKKAGGEIVIKKKKKTKSEEKEKR